jgi:hypothetical protein
MAQNDEAYEIIITPLISHESHDRVRKVEAVQTKTLTFFRYVYLALYHGYDAVIEEKIFLSEEDAIRFWNKEVANLCIIPNSPECISIAT